MKKINVLLVDDNEDFLQILSMRVESWGYGLIRANSGKEALSFLQKGEVDVVVLDYMMPEMDGVSVLRHIRSFNPIIPVIMFTAYPNMKVMQDTEDLGVSAFIPKLSIYSDTLNALKVAIDLAVKKLNEKQ